MKPRILFLDHSGELGGAELYLLDVARPYRDRSTVVVLDDGPFPDRLRAEGFHTMVLQDDDARLQSVQKSSRLMDALRAAPSIAQHVTRVLSHLRRHDLLFANSQKALIVGAIAGTLARRPIVWNLHDILTAEHFSRINRRVAVTCANWLVDRVIVNSEATRKAFTQSGGDTDKTGLVYNGIRATPFDAVSPDDVAAVRNELDVPEAPMVGVFSRLAPWKGQHVLIDALTALPDVHALFVGDALFAGDEAYAEQLRVQARRHDLTHRVHFLGFRDDIPTLMHAVDVVAHTSTAPEPFGRVIVEGMLAGRPVVATRAGGPIEIIQDDVNGKLVPPGDADRLADALRVLMSDPDRASQLAERGRRQARTRFSVDAMQDAIEENIQRVLT